MSKKKTVFAIFAECAKESNMGKWWIDEPYVIFPGFILCCLITICSIVCCIQSIHYLKDSGKEIKTRIKLAVGFIIVLCAIQSILYSLEWGLLTFSFGFTPVIRWTVYYYGTTLNWLLYPIELLGLYTLFGIKLIYSFNNSIVQISKCNQNTFYASVVLGWISYFTVQIICYIFIYKLGYWFLLQFITAYGVLFYLITFIMLLKMFYIQIKTCANILFDNDSLAQKHLFDMAVRQMTCCILALFTTVINGVIYGVLIATPWWQFHIIPSNADTTLNIICLIFQYSFCEDKYYKFCNKFDLLFKYCFRQSSNAALDVFQILSSRSVQFN